VKTLEEEVTLVGNNLRSLEVSEGEVSQKFSCSNVLMLFSKFVMTLVLL